MDLNKQAPAQLAFIAEITFCMSEREGRVTRVMDFGTMVDWAKSAHDYFVQMVRAGDYDGTEIFVDIYELGPEDTEDTFDFLSTQMIDQFVIDNS